MKTRKQLTAAVLLFAVLLSQLCGGFVSSAASQIVVADSELAYEPLAQTASIAYEQHEDGYAVSLDRAEDHVAMNITAVPKSSRTADKARLYIRTGVELKPGTTYQVSFVLSAQNTQKEYAVCFDSGSVEAAYGKLDRRAIEAGGADRVTYQISPKKESGELVLRLLLGNTGLEGNILRFSDLAVEEALEDEVKENVVLVDDLDYNTPGAVSIWTNTGSRVAVTPRGASTVLSVLEKPEKGAAPWEIQLKVATGLKPQPGKAYRVSISLNSSAVREYEACYNEGGVEKGYGALYGQWLEEGSQTLSRLILIPEDKEDPGELILQLSLGKLIVGDKVTVSNIRVTEAIPKYSNALSRDFAYDKTWVSEGKEQDISGGTTIPTDINWSGAASVSAGGDHSGGVTVDGGSATLKINAGGTEVYHAYLQIDTGETLEAGTAYAVSYEIDTAKAYSSSAEILYGNESKDRVYGGLYGHSLPAGKSTVTQKFTASESGTLRIKLQLGKTDGKAANTITLSGLKIQKLAFGAAGGSNLATVTYPTTGGSTTTVDPGSFSVRDGHGSISGGSSNSATMTCAQEGNTWERGMFIGNICDLTAGTSYQVSFDLQTDNQAFTYKVCYNRNGHFNTDQDNNQEKGFGEKTDVSASSTKSTVTQVITPAEGKGGKLLMFLDFEHAETGTEVTVSNIKVQKLVMTPIGNDLASVTYPSSGNNGSFEVRENCGTLTGSGTSATIDITGSANLEGWKKALFINNICSLENESQYEVSIKVSVDKTAKYRIRFFGGNEKYNESVQITDKYCDTQYDGPEIKQSITAKENGQLTLRIDLGDAPSDAKVTVSDIQVKKLEATPTGDNLAAMTYPSVTTNSSGVAPGSFVARDNCGTFSVGDDANSATITISTGFSDYQRALFVNQFCQLSAGKSYEVSFDIKAAGDTPYTVQYCKNDEKWDAGAFGSETGTATTGGTEIKHTMTPAEDGQLTLRIDLKEAVGKAVTVSDIQVKEVRSTVADEKTIDSFSTSSVWIETGEGYGGALFRGRDSADFMIWKEDDAEAATWKAKLNIDTGVPYEAGKAYRVSFDIESPDAYRDFCAVYNTSDDAYRGKWGQTLSPNEKKTIVSDGLPAGNGNLTVSIELGKFSGGGNSVTVSNVEVEEVDLSIGVVTKLDGAATLDLQPGYKANIDRKKDSATLHIIQSPADGAEAWKVKMFLATGVHAYKDTGYRVTFDVLAEKDMDFEVCYNKNGDEKGFDALYGLHAEGGKTMTVKKTFVAADEGDLNLQFNLGLVPAPNSVTVSNLKVERVSFSSSGRNVLPSGVDCRAPGAVSYWAHEDYTTAFTGSDNAITANITSAPAKGAEPWKIKLFVDTGTVLKPGKHYRVTADVKAEAAQDFEICYNSGSAEMGYDALGGLRLEAGTRKTVEKTISVSPDKADAGNLTLQFNLGKTTGPNQITVSGVKVEEVFPEYHEMMEEGFSYDTGASLWTNPDYTAALECSDNSATAHITQPSADSPEVWKVKLFVNTGAVLSAGRTYLVRADLLAAQGQNYEVCFNNEETEKGFDVLYGQTITAGRKKTVERKISVPASMTDAGELILQFAVGGSAVNDITVSNVSVREIRFGADGSGEPVPDTVIGLYNAPDTAAGSLEVTREKLTYKMTKISPQVQDNAITISGAGLRADDRYTVSFTAKADRELTGTFVLDQASGQTTAISEQFKLTDVEAEYSFTTKDRLLEGGFYDLLWRFGSADGQELGGADVEISDISVYSPQEKLNITHLAHNVTVKGKTETPDTYNINGNNYIKLRDLAMLLNDTDAQFVVRYNSKSDLISLTTGKPYVPVGGELTVDVDRSASCRRSSQTLLVNGKAVDLKAYNFGGNNFFRLRDLNELLGFKVDHVAGSKTVTIASPPTPEAQEKAHAYDLFFLPELDGSAQPYVGDTMPYYEDGTYYIYYLKDGGDSYNHSVYLITTKDFVTYTEHDDPVLSASRADVQDNWIGTGSVVKVEDTYYLFYTGFNASGSQEYHEKIMVAKGSSPTSFEKVTGWEIVPPASLGQKNDFRDPQAYYDPATQTISLTITAGQDGKARILKYTLGKDLQNANYDGIIFTDADGLFWNMECSDTFRIGNKWYLTYSGQDDTLWYAMADSRFGPYSAPARLEGKLFYAAKHVEDGKNSYMVGWARRSNSVSSTREVAGWAGNVAVQKLQQRQDGSLILVPVDSVVCAFDTQRDIALGASEVTLTAGPGYSYKEAFTSYESFMLSGEFTCSGTGSFGLAFDFNGSQERYKLISIDPAENKLDLSFDEGEALITETKAAISPDQKHSFTYIQDGSVGIFYLDGQAALTVRLYGVTGKPIYLFAENNSVTFTSLRQYTR